MGGALLMALLVAGAYLPSPPVVEQVETRQTKVRIHSDKKLPERVVFDTSMPAVTHPVDPMTAKTDTQSGPPSADDLSAKARQAFARLQSSDTSKAKVAELKRPEFKTSPSRRGETRKHAPAPRKIRLARQPQFDWFGGRMLW
jgi:hypothetical protein